MKAISESISNYQIKTAENLKSDRIQHAYQDYGLLVCNALQLEPCHRGRIMGFIKRTNSGYALHSKANELLRNQKFLKMTQDERIRYLFGAYKRSL
jgi:hypothetical protein